MFSLWCLIIASAKEKKDVNDTVCNKKSHKKRRIQKNTSPVLSQDEEADPESPGPQAKKQCKRNKASVRKGKTTVVTVHGEKSFLLS